MRSKTERSVVDAAPLKIMSDVVALCPPPGWVKESPPVDEIVTEDEPMTVNCVHDAEPEHEAVVVATDR